MSSSTRLRLKFGSWRELKRRVEGLKKRTGSKERAEAPRVPEDPVAFARELFGFTPTEYQARLLRDPSKRIVVRWCRQEAARKGVTPIAMMRANSLTYTILCHRQNVSQP
jgi:hypothetical protein